MIIAAVTLAKCNLDVAIGMLMEPSQELLKRKKLLDEVRGAKEKNLMKRSQEALKKYFPPLSALPDLLGHLKKECRL